MGGQGKSGWMRWKGSQESRLYSFGGMCRETVGFESFVFGISDDRPKS